MDVDWLGLYLLEDLGAGDATSDAVFGPDARGAARVVARAPTVIAGVRHAVELFARLGAQAQPCAKDGERVAAGALVLEVRGPVRALLAGERVALNLMARMSGIASATRAGQDVLEAAGLGGRVTGTRKTTPGFRVFEKEAIALGGGDPHRMGLWDAAMLKDNHLAACDGDVAAAVAAVRRRNGPMLLTCEVETERDALAAAASGADWILIDNQAADVGAAWARKVRAAHPHVRIEASGGIRMANLAAYGWADRISMGWLTQGAPAADLAMDWSGGGAGERGTVNGAAGAAANAPPTGGKRST